MSDEWSPPPPPKPRRRWPRRLAWAAAISFVLLVAIYFFVTSFTFLDLFVLPRVSQAVNAKFTLEDASIRPFFKISLRGLKVQTSALGEPLLTAKLVRARYSLIDIIGGHINVSEVRLESPVINLLEDENGATNLDPLLKSSSSSDKKPPAPSPPPASQKSKPLQLNVQSVTITNAIIRRLKQRKDGGRDLAELSNVNLTVNSLGNGLTGRLGLGAAIKLDNTPAATSTNGARELLEAKLAGGFNLSLSGELKPQSVNGKLALDLATAPEAFRDLAGVGLALDCDISPTEIKQFALTFGQGGAILGQIAASGPLDLAKQEGQIKLEISSIDRRVLNLAGATLGIDFGPTTINASNEIVLASGGQLITASGRFGVNQLCISQKGVTTKPLDLQLNYNVALNQAEKSALVNNFTLTGTQNQEALLRGTLARPMKLSFGGASNAVEESAFDLVLTNLHLADWQAFIGDYAGTASLTLNILAEQAGQKLKLDLASRIDGLAAAFGSNRIDRADLAMAVHARMEDFRRVQLQECALKLSQQNQPALAFSSAGSCDIKSQEADIKTTIEAFVPTIAALLAKPELKASSGKLSLRAQISQKNSLANPTNTPNPAPNVIGSFQLEDLTAEYDAYKFNHFETAMNFDLGLSNQLAEIRKFSGTLKQAGQDGGSFEIAGNYHLTNQTGHLACTVTNLNQNVLSTFLAPALGDKKLANVSITLSTTADYAAKGESSVNTELRVADLLITDPKGELPKLPLTLEVKLDAGLRDALANIRQFKGMLRQGELDGGRFEVNGNYDLNKRVGQVALKLKDLNQNALRPLLASALGDKTLRSVSINIDTAASYDAKGESSINGNFQLANLLVTDPKNQLPKAPFTADVKLDAALRNDQADIRELAANLKLGELPGGALLVNGKYDLKKQSGQIALKLKDLNQNALGPFLAAPLGDKKLSSVSINVDTEASYDPHGPALVKGKIDVSNLLVTDPAGKLPKTPLAVGLTLNGGFVNQIVNLEQFLVTLSPTARARNELSLTGKVDVSGSNVYSGELQLAAESLDLTPYYDLFAAQTAATNAPGTKTAQVTAPVPTPVPATTSSTEPAPVSLPLRQFTLGVNVGHLYLREIEIDRWQTTAKADRSTVNLKPFQLTLNGAPVNATVDLNLGVTGFQYDVAFAADKIPIEPIANTFMPQSRGQYKGDLISRAQIKGAGVTGASLQKNLGGQLALSFTNANLQIASPRMKVFFLPIGVLLGTPDLMNSPLNWVGASAQIGQGKINLTHFNLASDTFSADTQGEIKIAEVLMNSPLEKWPMHFYLRRNLAERIKMAPRNTPPDAAYAKLPDFIKVAGTLGAPKAELNALALGGGVLEKVTDKIGLKEKAGGLLDLLVRPK